MKANLFLILCVAVLCGCANGNKFTEPCAHYNRLQVATFYGPGTPTPKPYGTAVPYYSESEIKQPFKPIAFMSCEGDIREEAAILKAMLYRASNMGADGVLLNAHGIGQDEPSNGNNQTFDIRIHRGAGWMSMVGNSDHRCFFRATAIRLNP